VYVTLTRVKTSDQPIGNAAIVGEEMERWLREIDGFEGFLMLSREGTTMGISFWESREAAERNRATRVAFIERISSVAGVEIEEMLDFDVTYANVRQLRADGASTL
jgi:hypothetical protein